MEDNTLETDDSSAGKCSGSTICHEFALVLERTIESAPFFLISSFVIPPSSSFRIEGASADLLETSSLGLRWEDQYRAPIRAHSTRVVTSSPRSFMVSSQTFRSRCYLLFHQTPIPRISTIPGSNKRLVALTMLICPFVIVMRRSSSGFGRIEIKSSSEESQLIVFSARSSLPLKLTKRLDTHDELPTTTNRPWEFSFPVLYVPAAASVNGPCLFLGSFKLIFGELRSLVARLLLEESKSFSTLLLSVFFTCRDRAKGMPTAVPFISETIGCDSYAVTSAT